MSTLKTKPRKLTFTGAQVNQFRQELSRHIGNDFVNNLSDGQLISKGIVNSVLLSEVMKDPRFMNKDTGQQLLLSLGNAKETAEFAQKAAQAMTSSQFDTESFAQDLPNQFIDLVVDESVLLKACTVYRTNKRSGNAVKLTVDGHITEKATENGTSTETRKITDTPMSYLTVKTRSQFDITGEVEEDNIEGPSGRSTILDALVRYIQNDMETLAIEGDSSVSGSDDASRLLSANDGWHKLTATGTGAHLVTAGAKRASRKLLLNMLRNMPTKYLKQLQSMRWIGSYGTLYSLMDEVQTRATPLGDKAYEGSGFNVHGINYMPVPLLPQDLTVSGTQSTGTFLWLADPKNFVFVVQRYLKVWSEFIMRYDRWEVTAYMRTDFMVNNTDAVVKATNVLVDDAVAFYGA